MQFKRQANKIQVLTYTGYDNEKKRAIVKMLGSLDAYSLEPSVGLLDKLTVEQKDELQSYIKSVRQSADERLLQSASILLDSNIIKVADGLLDGSISYSSDSAAKIWSAMGMLGKALKQSGHPKPTRAYKRSKVQPVVDNGTADLLSE